LISRKRFLSVPGRPAKGNPIADEIALGGGRVMDSRGPEKIQTIIRRAGGTIASGKFWHTPLPLPMLCLLE
jgi:hypothetical protein